MNTYEIPIQHRDMINRLFKHGDVLLPQLTPNDVELLHAAIGIAGEAAELEKAVLTMRLSDSLGFDSDWGSEPPYPGLDIENIIEELGDHLFYEGALRIAAGLENLEGTSVEYVSFSGPGVSRKRALCNLISMHSVLAGDILDVIKKKVMYRKELNVEKLKDLLLRDCYVVMEMANLLGRSQSDIRQHNINKLEKGPNARYKAGYTDAAAQQRADKEGAE